MMEGMEDSVVRDAGVLFARFDQVRRLLAEEPDVDETVRARVQSNWRFAIDVLVLQPAHTAAGRRVKACALLALNHVPFPSTYFREVALSLAHDLLRADVEGATGEDMAGGANG